MKKESEKNIERKLKQEVKNAGGWCLKLAPFHVAGLPDRICLFPEGRVVFVETKSTGDKPKKIQVVIHNKLIALGFRVEVIDRISQVYELISEYK